MRELSRLFDDAVVFLQEQIVDRTWKVFLRPPCRQKLLLYTDLNLLSLLQATIDELYTHADLLFLIAQSPLRRLSILFLSDHSIKSAPLYEAGVNL
jgi:hypothetical protein